MHFASLFALFAMAVLYSLGCPHTFSLFASAFHVLCSSMPCSARLRCFVLFCFLKHHRVLWLLFLLLSLQSRLALNLLPFSCLSFLIPQL